MTTNKFVIKNLPRPNGKFSLSEQDVSELHMDIQEVDLRHGHAIVILSKGADSEAFLNQLNGSEAWKRTLTVVPWVPKAQFEQDRADRENRGGGEARGRSQTSGDGQASRGRSQSRGRFENRGRSQSRGRFGGSGPRGPRTVEVRGSNNIVIVLPSVSDFLGMYEYTVSTSETGDVKIMSPTSEQALVGCGTYDPALLTEPSPSKKKFKKAEPNSVTVIHKRTLGVVTEIGEIVSREGVEDEVLAVVNAVKGANLFAKNLVILRFGGEGVLTSLTALISALSKKIGTDLNLASIHQLSQGAQEIPVFRLQKWPEDDE